MGMKFLNKKGWHTGSLRNIENVWKAEQKQEAEQKKLEELRLQIVQERERSEFRALQEQAGLVPRQERLDFLYDSGLAVGKGNASSSGVSFQKEEQPLDKAEAGNSTNEKPDQSAPGALFEDKAQSANDSWRKLHSDPLLLIRQREQEALARIKNNPVKMALIRKSVEEKGKSKDRNTKEHKKKHKRRKQSSSRQYSDSEEDSGEENKRRKRSHRQQSPEIHNKLHERPRSDLDGESRRRETHDKHYDRSHDRHYERSHDKHYERRRSDLDDEPKRREDNDKHYERKRSDLDESRRQESHRETRRNPASGREDPKRDYTREDRKSKTEDLNNENYPAERENRHRKGGFGSKLSEEERKRSDLDDGSKIRGSHKETRHNSRSPSPNTRSERENLRSSYTQRKTEDFQHPARRRKGGAGSKLTEEERAERLKQMQMDAEVHEEQRWKRIKKADETDAVEADKNKVSTGKSFLDDANKSVYGIEKGGSSTIEESVRRRSYYSQRGNEAEGNAFRR